MQTFHIPTQNMPEGKREALSMYHTCHAIRPMEAVVRLRPMVAIAKPATWQLAQLINKTNCVPWRGEGYCKKIQSVMMMGLLGLEECPVPTHCVVRGVIFETHALLLGAQTEQILRGHLA